MKKFLCVFFCVCSSMFVMGEKTNNIEKELKKMDSKLESYSEILKEKEYVSTSMESETFLKNAADSVLSLTDEEERKAVVTFAELLSQKWVVGSDHIENHTVNHILAKGVGIQNGKFLLDMDLGKVSMRERDMFITLVRKLNFLSEKVEKTRSLEFKATVEEKLIEVLRLQRIGKNIIILWIADQAFWEKMLNHQKDNK